MPRRTVAATASPCVATAPGTRTSNPTAASAGPVTVINSHASSWLSATWPATLRARSVEGGEQPPEPRPLARHRSAAALGPQRSVDRDRLALGRWCVDRHEPDPAGAGRVELHDEPRTRRRRHGTRPVLECSSTGPRRAQREHGTVSRPFAAINASLRSLVVFTVGGGAGRLHALDALGGDRIDHRGDHRRRDRRATAAVDRGHRPRHRRGERSDRRAVRERRTPPHLGVGQSTLRALGDTQSRHDRPARRQPNPFERDVAEPQHTRADAGPAVAAAHRNEPTQRVLHRDGERVGRIPPGSWTPGWSCQPNGGPPIASSRVDNVVVRLRHRAPAGRPHHHLPRRPRGLQLHHARLHLVACDRLGRLPSGRRRRRPGARPGDGPTQTVERLSNVGDDLVALVTDQRARRGEVTLDVDDQPIQHRRATPAHQHGSAPNRRPNYDHPQSTRSPLQVLMNRSSDPVVVSHDARRLMALDVPGNKPRTLPDLHNETTPSLRGDHEPRRDPNAAAHSTRRTTS